MRAIVLIGLITAISGSFTLPILAGESQRRRGGGEETPAFERAPDALERVSWRTRTLVGDGRLTNWKFGISAAGLPGLTFLEAVVRADAAGVPVIEGSDTLKVSPQLQKNLDFNLTEEEIATARNGMGNIRMLAYRVEQLGADADSQRKLFAFAKAMRVDTIVAPLGSASAADLDKLANEFEVNVALLGRPETVLSAIESQSKRLSLAADTGRWMEYNRTPAERLPDIKDRLSYVNLRDRSAMGNDGRNVPLGKGVGQFTEFFNELNRLNVRPLILTLDTAGVVNQPADLFAAVDAFEAVVQPAYGKYFTEWTKSKPAPRLDVPDEARQRIEAAIPAKPYVAPKEPRKILVMESLQGMYHNTIPHCNVMIDLMGKKTGAWETEFSNDLGNLKWPKIKEYDAIFVNSAVGEMFADLEIRESLARYVREGGGLGGVHGTPWASRNWQEFADMIGARSAPHRIEQGVMHVYDSGHPLVKPFGGKPLPFREEYYRFEHEGYNRLMWEDVRVLLTVELDDPRIEPRPWNGYKRPDNIYPVTWIRSYGQGRTFYCSLGHIPDTFMTPEISGHFLAGIQFLVGDLPADTTPNPPQAAKAP